MRRVLLTTLTVLSLAACRRSERDQGSGLVPPADAPANPAEPASAPTAAQGPDYEAAIDAGGTAPDWTLRIRRDSLVLSRPGRLDLLAVNGGPQIDGPSAEWRETATHGVLLRVTLKPGDCVDASGRHRPLRATVMAGDDLLEGCAAPAEGPPSGLPAAAD